MSGIKYTSDAPNAPKAVGPYSQAVEAWNFVFLSGQLGIDPATGKLAEGGFEAQTEQVLLNLKAVLAHRGLDFSRVVKTTVFLTDLGNFQKFNEIYTRHMEAHKPARSTFQVSALPLGGAVEIELVAARL
jgi:2-iminobutanoate/2-iminopropanoate deaminase